MSYKTAIVVVLVLLVVMCWSKKETFALTTAPPQCVPCGQVLPTQQKKCPDHPGMCYYQGLDSNGLPAPLQAAAQFVARSIESFCGGSQQFIDTPMESTQYKLKTDSLLMKAAAGN